MLANHRRADSRWFVPGLLMLFIALGSCTDQAPVASSGTHEANLTTVSVPIDGMSCLACAARVKKTLASIEGVTSVEVDLGARAARVRYAPARVSADRFPAAINALGYRADAPTEVE